VLKASLWPQILPASKWARTNLKEDKNRRSQNLSTTPRLHRFESAAESRQQRWTSVQILDPELESRSIYD